MFSLSCTRKSVAHGNVERVAELRQILMLPLLIINADRSNETEDNLLCKVFCADVGVVSRDRDVHAGCC